MPRSTRRNGARRAGERCIALAGKGTPGSAELEDAFEAVATTATALRDLKRRGGHEFKLRDPEVRLRAPLPSGRGGAGWTVLVRVPASVTPRDVREAAAAAAHHHPLAKSIRLSPLQPGAAPKPAPRGRDRMPGRIRETRTTPQHRARELARRGSTPRSP